MMQVLESREPVRSIFARLIDLFDRDLLLYIQDYQESHRNVSFFPCLRYQADGVTVAVSRLQYCFAYLSACTKALVWQH